MRLKVNLQAKPNQIIPINYLHFLSSSIYHLLAKANLEFSSSLHQGEHISSSKKFKFFTFSWLQIPKKQILNSTIKVFSPEITWFISSPWQEFVQYLVNGLLELGSIRVGKENFPIIQVETLSDSLIPSPTLNPPSPLARPASRSEAGEGEGRMRGEGEDEYKFLCLSPLVVTTKKEYNGKLAKYYYRPSDDQNEISEKIRQNLINKYVAFYQKESENTDLEILFDQQYIKKPDAEKLIDYKGIKIKAILCPFTAVGSADLIKFGYECGFGELNSAGFGMVRNYEKNNEQRYK